MTGSRSARSQAALEFLLVVLVATVGPVVERLVVQLDWTTRGLTGAVLMPALTFATSGLVPVLIARSRGEGWAAFGLDGPPAGIRRGSVCALPVLAAGAALSWSSPLRGGPASLFGALAYAFGGPLETFRNLAGLAAAFGGMVALWTFLTVRARRMAPEPAVNPLGALRTAGVAVAASSIPLGLVVAARGSIGAPYVLVFAGTLVGVVLLAGRLVEVPMDVSIVAVLAPAGVALLRQLAGLGGDPVAQLWLGLLAGGLVVVVSALVVSRRYAWAVVPLLVVATIHLTPLRPI